MPTATVMTHKLPEHPKTKSERINEFARLLESKNLMLHESVQRETVLATEDSPSINPLTLGEWINARTVSHG